MLICASWSITTCGLLGLRFACDGILRKFFVDLMELDKARVVSKPFLVVYSVQISISEFLAQISLIISLRQKFKMWIDRLSIFPLGLPDGVLPPDPEMLKQLQEEILRNRFNESLLESDDVNDDVLRSKLRCTELDENFAFSDDTSTLYAKPVA